MAVTILSKPQDVGYRPGYNEHWLVASSTNIAQPNFKYYITITDVITSTSWIEKVDQRPDGKLVIDLGTYAEKYMQSFVAPNVYGWQKCANAIRKIQFNVGEWYGTPPTNHTGTNLAYIAWNAGLDYDTYLNYDVANYVYDNTVPRNIFLTNTLMQKTYVDRSRYLYVLVQEGNTADVPSISIYTYNSAGANIGIYTIPRPSFTTGIYTDQYACIDIGYKGLLNISSGLVTVVLGSYPIITSSVDFYTIQDDTTSQIIKRINIDCQPKFTCYTLHYLNSKGAYESLDCSLLSQESEDIINTTYKTSPWTLNASNIMVLDPQLAFEKTQGVTINPKLKLNSDWISQSEMDLHKDLFASTNILLDRGSSLPYIKVASATKTFVSNDGGLLSRISIDINYLHTNHRQRG